MTHPPGLEQHLRELLAERGAAVEADIDSGRQVARFTARLPRERRRGRLQLAGAAVTAAAAVVALVVVVLGLVGSAGHSRPVPIGPSPLPAPAPTLAPESVPVAVSDVTTSRFTQPSADLVVGNVLWVDDVSEATISRIDLTTHQVLSSRRYYAEQPGYTGTMLAADGVVLLPMDDTFAGGGARILRFDAETGRALASIVVGRIIDLTVTPAGVFARIDVGQVARIDPRSGVVLRQFDAPPGRGVVYADGLLWVWDLVGQQLVGLDPASGQYLRAIALEGFRGLPLIGDGPTAVVMQGPGGLARVDVRAGTVTATTPITTTDVSRDSSGRLWAVVAGTHLIVLDGETLAMIHDYRVPPMDLVHAADGRVFFTERSTGRVGVYDVSDLIN
jgi:outer membrane protein assembly factor BamB